MFDWKHLPEKITCAKALNGYRVKTQWNWNNSYNMRMVLLVNEAIFFSNILCIEIGEICNGTEYGLGPV